MSPSPNSEARKRGDEKAAVTMWPVPGYVLTTRGEAARAGWECVDLDDFSTNEAADAEYLADATWEPSKGADSPWLVIARPPRPRKVTIELDEDVVKRLANAAPDVGDHRIIHEACLAALDGDK